ncbi:MAG: hypothetical protein WBO48_25270 [Candidatus Promineifilaceae bacterium]|nr:hypothetical protein [Chloroflexota bacterium]MBK8935090.1 hypothetical protein [Chloroflexota bacterium]
MRRLLVLIIIFLVIVVGFFFYETAVAPETVAPETVETPLTPYPCPQATPELFTVEPVTSPTDAASQMVRVSLGNGELITITSESGTVSGTAVFPADLEVPLLPQTTHHLTVTGLVRQVMQGDCAYGGYELSTTTDLNGNPLIIERN